MNKPIIKAISIDSKKDVELSKTFEPFCEMILFDTKLETSEIRGGTESLLIGIYSNIINQKKNGCWQED